ncbi:uncharacterized protein LOC126843242 isoform X2 [Adelges cooleyi]|nr:uncharacterized protein LOC126843242 isoform X2 [Adelges cooleyi]
MTSPPSRCLVYDITGLTNRSDVHDTSDNIHLFGELKADPSLPSKMFVSIPSDDDENSFFVVFTTDYLSYAGVYTCQKNADHYKHSVIILSRSVDIAETHIELVDQIIRSANENPNVLSKVDHLNCNHLQTNLSGNSNDQNVIDKKLYISVKFKKDKEINPDTISSTSNINQFRNYPERPKLRWTRPDEDIYQDGPHLIWSPKRDEDINPVHRPSLPNPIWSNPNEAINPVHHSTLPNPISARPVATGEPVKQSQQAFNVDSQVQSPRQKRNICVKCGKAIGNGLKSLGKCLKECFCVTFCCCLQYHPNQEEWEK